MACLGGSAAALRACGASAAEAREAAAHPARSGGAGRRPAARVRPVGGGRAASQGRLIGVLQPRPSALAVVPRAAADGASGGAVAVSRKQRGRLPSLVPDVDAEQLLRSLGLDGAADPAALLKRLRKLPGVRQQGVLDNATAVAAHLRSPAVGLPQQQAGQLLERCPELFSWPPEQRAAVLFGQLMEAGLTATAAAACFSSYPETATRTSLAAGLAELAAILAHSQDRDGNSGGPQPLPAAQRTVAALFTRNPSAVQPVCNSAGYLQQRAAELQQAGYTASEVAAIAWGQPPLLCRNGAARLAGVATVLQQELGLAAAQFDSLAARHPHRWLMAGRETLRARAAALAQAVGREAAAAALMARPDVLSCPPAVWRRNLCYMAACGVADPKAVLLRCPQLFCRDHASSEFLQRRLLLQQAFGLTAAQLYARPHCLLNLEPGELAQRLQFVEQRGQAHRLVAKAAGGCKPAAASAQERLPALSLVAVTHGMHKFLPVVGASQAEWEAWAAANPPAACPLYRWAQQAAAEEAARLAAALPPELVQNEPVFSAEAEVAD